jgi:hypothetical protein
MTAVRTAADGGSSFAKIEIGTAAMAAVLCTFTLPKPMSSESGGVLTLLGTPLSVTASGAGTAAAARVRDSNSVDIVTGLTVGQGSGDISLDNTNIAVGQTITLTGGTITHG